MTRIFIVAALVMLPWTVKAQQTMTVEEFLFEQAELIDTNTHIMNWPPAGDSILNPAYTPTPTVRVPIKTLIVHTFGIVIDTGKDWRIPEPHTVIQIDSVFEFVRIDTVWNEEE